MDSILNTTKKLLGINSDYNGFDTDIILHINTAFWNLKQLGVGPYNGFSIKGENENWDEFLGTSNKLEAIKSYIYYSVRLAFDPPQSTVAIESYRNMLKELEWRLMVELDPMFGYYSEEVILTKKIYNNIEEVI